MVTYSIFNNTHTISIPKAVLEDYTKKVSIVRKNTINYLIDVLDLNDSMSDEELSKIITDAMIEDCKASEAVKTILSNSETLQDIIGR